MYVRVYGGKESFAPAAPYATFFYFFANVLRTMAAVVREGGRRRDCNSSGRTRGGFLLLLLVSPLPLTRRVKSTTEGGVEGRGSVAFMGVRVLIT